MSSAGGALEKFKQNISFVSEKISERNAYLGVLGGFAAFFFSLFFSWSEVRSGVNVADAGSSTGWAEGGYVSVIPLVFLLYRVLKDTQISVKTPVIAGVLSLALLFINNVVGRTTWIQRSGVMGWDKSDLGSDLGLGYWIGLLSLMTIFVCGIAWAIHKEAVSGDTK